jgi:nucleotide-binding universal stress UspA family protein
MDVMYRKILVPVDSSEHSRRALQHAIALARCQEPHVALLHCLGRIPMLIGGEPREELLREMEREARKLLAPYAKRLREAGIEPALFIKEGRPGDCIVREAESGDYDLIVMGSRGLSDLQGMLMGSDAHRVLSSSHCPVLLIR